MGWILARFYTEPYEAPGIANTLERVGLDEGRARCVTEEFLTESARGQLGEGFWAEDAAAVGLYTFEFGRDEDYERSPYRVIRRTEGVRDCIGRTEVVAEAPQVHGVDAVPGHVWGSGHDLVQGGETIVGAGSRPRPPTWGVTKVFLVKGSEDGCARGTLFVIKGWRGYDI